jgi:pSer/pThr/pTyr-binding forkhead associated (FHA) protein
VGAQNETYKDAQGPSRAEPQRADTLFLILEGERLSALGSRHSLARVDEVTFGRGESRSARRVLEGGARRLELRVPDRRMSSAHATIARSVDRFIVTDTGSTNGTRLNGRPLTRAVLADGDVLEMGWTTFHFRTAIPIEEGTPDDVDAAEMDRAIPGLATLMPAHGAALAKLALVARSEVPIVLLGETGTGK